MEGVTLMFAGAWCAKVGVGGWVLMGLLWATVWGRVRWEVSRRFECCRGCGGGTGAEGGGASEAGRGKSDLMVARYCEGMDLKRGAVAMVAQKRQKFA